MNERNITISRIIYSIRLYMSDHDDDNNFQPTDIDVEKCFFLHSFYELDHQWTQKQSGCLSLDMFLST